jgi:predicted nucleic acid-binding protein
MHLLDTGVVFELRKAKAGQTDRGLTAWATGAPRQSLFISVITLLELQTAAARLERRDRAAGLALRAWTEERIPKAFEGRMLPVDEAVVRRRGELAYADARDGLLAATALVHGLTLVTRETAAFRAGRVKVFNPWGYSPEAAEEGDWAQLAKAGPVWLKNLFIRS